MNTTVHSDYWTPVAAARTKPSLSAILGERVHLLGDVLADVREELKERKELSRHVISRIWEEYLELRGELLPLLGFPIRFDHNLDPRRASLE